MAPHALQWPDRLCSEARIDPVKHIVPIVLHHIVKRADVGQTVYTWVAWGNPVNQPIERDEIFILARCIILKKLLAVGNEIMSAHIGDKQRNSDVLKRPRRRIIAGAPIDLIALGSPSRTLFTICVTTDPSFRTNLCG